MTRQVGRWPETSICSGIASNTSTMSRPSGMAFTPFPLPDPCRRVDPRWAAASPVFGGSVGQGPDVHVLEGGDEPGRKSISPSSPHPTWMRTRGWISAESGSMDGSSTSSGSRSNGRSATRNGRGGDVFAELRKWRAMRVRGGCFKVPFGRERLTSISDLDFARRSIATEALTPGRDTGIELNGRILGRALNYQTGVFQHDGDVSRGGTDAPAGRTVAARVVSTPFAWARLASFSESKSACRWRPATSRRD